MAKKVRDTESFLHNCTRKMLFIFYIAGLFPVSGLLRTSTEFLRFNPFSMGMLIFIISFILKLMETFANIYLIVTNSLNLKTVVESVLDVLKISRMLLMFRLAYVWPKLIKSTREIETNLSADKKRILKQCNLLYIVFNVFNIVVDSFFVWYYCQLATVCSEQDDEPPFESIVRYTQPVAFRFTSYETWKGIVVLLSFCHNNYIKDIFDIFLMQISIYLNSFFEDFNELIRENAELHKEITFAWTVEKQSHVEELDWSALRLKYVNISRLVRMVNNKISAIIFITFGNDLILLWGQLLMIFRRGQFVNMNYCDVSEFRDVWTSYNYSRVIYLYSSTSGLLLRIFVTSFLASKIYTSSKKSELTLYEISQSLGPNIEVDRLIMQIINSTIALNGLGFFNVTKTMMLSMAGTVVTYELMVLQFATNINNYLQRVAPHQSTNLYNVPINFTVTSSVESVTLK